MRLAAVLSDHDAIAAVLTTDGQITTTGSESEYEFFSGRTFSHAVLSGNGRLLVCECTHWTGILFLLIVLLSSPTEAFFPQLS
jgi:hypothetical protein